MPLELIDAPPGDPRNARFLATAVDLAYLNEGGSAKFAEELGLDAKLVSVGNTQVYVGHNPQHIVCAFRGSESPATVDGFKDWFLTNANNLLVLPEGAAGTDFAAAGVGARFHRGFLDALEALWAPFYAAVDEAYAARNRPVWVCGHSLGGALALLASWRLERNFVPVHQVVTFGAPMIGNAEAARAIEGEFKNRVFRFIDTRDMVPKLPTLSLTSNAYEHCQTEVALDSGALENVPDTAIWNAVLGNIESHLMNNYLTRIGERCG